MPSRVMFVSVPTKKLKSGEVKITKPPINPKTGELARTNDLTTFSSLGDAKKAYRSGKYDGVGVVLTEKDKFIAVDLDNCLKNGKIIDPKAEKIVNDLLTSYSKRGIKQLFLITNRINKNRKENNLFAPLPVNVEIYQNFFSNPLLSTKQPIIFILKVLLYFIASIQFGIFLYKKKIKIIHLHLVNIDVLLLVFYKFLFRYKLILTFTGLELELAEAGYTMEFIPIG